MRLQPSRFKAGGAFMSDGQGIGGGEIFRRAGRLERDLMRRRGGGRRVAEQVAPYARTFSTFSSRRAKLCRGATSRVPSLRFSMARAAATAPAAVV